MWVSGWTDTDDEWVILSTDGESSDDYVFVEDYISDTVSSTSTPCSRESLSDEPYFLPTFQGACLNAKKCCPVRVDVDTSPNILELLKIQRKIMMDSIKEKRRAYRNLRKRKPQHYRR